MPGVERHRPGTAEVEHLITNLRTRVGALRAASQPAAYLQATRQGPLGGRRFSVAIPAGWLCIVYFVACCTLDSIEICCKQSSSTSYL